MDEKTLGEVDTEIRRVYEEVVTAMGHLAVHFLPKVEFKRELGRGSVDTMWLVFFHERDDLPVCESCEQKITNIDKPSLIMVNSAESVIRAAQRRFAAETVPA